MKELLEHYTVAEIIIFLVAAGTILKGAVDFYDWGKARIKRIFDKEYTSEKKQDSIDKKFMEEDRRIKTLEENQTIMIDTLSKLNTKVDLLIESDKDDIKLFLTQKHHKHVYELKWIDDYNLECCERKYAQYLKENKEEDDDINTSFIEGFMKELRALPKVSPIQENN